ncbi:MAG: (deoxy)nucleoside triphosphate pyrophosphohydrolase [Candidatus Riflebacteria bacterium]|nr:(deoxy)nucleoside triphosphate pyrophosphohydrolase [Candidatus Riflebacteria bacterium]
MDIGRKVRPSRTAGRRVNATTDGGLGAPRPVPLAPPASLPRSLKLVAAGLVRLGDRVLLARRAAGSHLAGLWEFPGGKLEPGESPQDCLVRELAEEVGLAVRVLEPYTIVFHRYEPFDLLMLVYECEVVSGEPRPLECAEVRWATVAEAGGLEFPPADEPILAKWRLEAAAPARW